MVEVGAVIVQLLVSSSQVLAFALILPAEETALPYICIALVVANLVDMLLKGVFGALGIGVCGLRLVQDVAKTIKVGLRARSLSSLSLQQRMNSGRLCFMFS